jgi:RNA recognition motif-containing protein
MSPSWNKNKAITTLMLRNIPNKYSQVELLEDVIKAGFRPGIQLDFFYLPIDAETGLNKGYCFLNFITTEDALEFQKVFHQKPMRRYYTNKITEVSHGNFQGLRGLWFYYRRQVKSAHDEDVPLFWPLTKFADDMAIYTVGEDGVPMLKEEPRHSISSSTMNSSDGFPVSRPSKQFSQKTNSNYAGSLYGCENLSDSPTHIPEILTIPISRSQTESVSNFSLMSDFDIESPNYPNSPKKLSSFYDSTDLSRAYWNSERNEIDIDSAASPLWGFEDEKSPNLNMNDFCLTQYTFSRKRSMATPSLQTPSPWNGSLRGLESPTTAQQPVGISQAPNPFLICRPTAVSTAVLSDGPELQPVKLNQSIGTSCYNNNNSNTPEIETEINVSSIPDNTTEYKSTYMLQNIRNIITQTVMISHLKKAGFVGGEHFDFLYIPVESGTGKNMCYAFINFTSKEAVDHFLSLEGETLPPFFQMKVKKVCESVKEATLQGIETNMAHYAKYIVQNSMKKRRPMFWKDGQKITKLTDLRKNEKENTNTPPKQTSNDSFFSSEESTMVGNSAPSSVDNFVGDENVLPPRSSRYQFNTTGWGQQDVDSESLKSPKYHLDNFLPIRVEIPSLRV